MSGDYCGGCGATDLSGCQCPDGPAPARPDGWRLTPFGEALVHAVIRTARDHGQLRPDSSVWLHAFVGSMMLSPSGLTVVAPLTEDERDWIDGLIGEYLRGEDAMF